MIFFCRSASIVTISLVILSLALTYFLYLMLYKVVEIILQHVGQVTCFKRPELVSLNGLELPHYLQSLLQITIRILSQDSNTE